MRPRTRRSSPRRCEGDGDDEPKRGAFAGPVMDTPPPTPRGITPPPRQSLPDEVTRAILRHLPVRKRVQCTTLSKRFRAVGTSADLYAVLRLQPDDISDGRGAACLSACLRLASNALRVLDLSALRRGLLNGDDFMNALASQPQAAGALRELRLCVAPPSASGGLPIQLRHVPRLAAMSPLLAAGCICVQLEEVPHAPVALIRGVQWGIEVSHLWLGDAAAVHIAEAISGHYLVTSLALVGTGVREAGVRSLAHHILDRPLKTLRLSGNYLGATGCVLVARVLATRDCQLECVDLSANFVVCDGAAALAVALKTNTTLRSLALRYNHIGGQGLASLRDMLVENATLELLDLRGNHGSDEALGVGPALRVDPRVRI